MQSKVTARLQRENTQDEIYEKIYGAILEHRLHPGTKLVEERLAEIFNVSRARIREVLARLALGRDLLGLVDDHVHVFVEALMKFFFETF